MRVRVIPGDRTACGAYRMRWVAEALAAQGHDVHVHEVGIVGHYDDRGLLHDVIVDADVLVLQRPGSQALVDAITVLRAKGVAVVVDMDDDLANIHPSNIAFDVWHPQSHPDHNWNHLKRACRQASMVTVSTPLLDERYGHGHGRLLRNCVPERAIHNSRDRCSATPAYDIPELRPRETDAPVFGWPGALHNHPADPGDASGAVARLVREGYRFEVVGNPEGCGRAFGIGEDPPGGRVAFDNWFSAIDTLDVAIAPLADTTFNAAKSSLKSLECSARGIPCVTSPSPEYAYMAQQGIGIVARKRKDWYPILRRLLSDPIERRERGDAAQEAARNWTIEGNAWRWLEAWSDALAAERASYRASA